jgi:hypothetical protein
MNFSLSMWNDILKIFSPHVGFYVAGKIAFYNLPKLSSSFINEIKNKSIEINYGKKVSIRIFTVNYNPFRFNYIFAS